MKIYFQICLRENIWIIFSQFSKPMINPFAMMKSIPDIPSQNGMSQLTIFGKQKS